MFNKKNKIKVLTDSYTRFLKPRFSFLQNQRNSSYEGHPDVSIYEELDEFYYQIYHSKKRQSVIYRAIFIGLGLLFLILASIVYLKTTNWSYHLYFSNHDFVKIFIYSFCLLLSVGAFGIAYSIRPKKEAFQEILILVEKKFTGQTNKNKSFQFKKDRSSSFQQMCDNILINMRRRQQKTIQLIEDQYLEH